MEQDRLDEIDAEPMERNRSVATNDRLSGAAVKRPQITDALTRTFFEEWSRVGYSALSLDAVARKAGVGKAALYRRWRSKADMAGACRGAPVSAFVQRPLPAKPGTAGALRAEGAWL